MSNAFLVWEPPQTVAESFPVDAETPCQAAFMAANERQIGFKTTTFAVMKNDKIVLVDVVPHVTYQVCEREEQREEPPEELSGAS